jgi:ABC-type lipoprotein release transport system permease subunit
MPLLLLVQLGWRNLWRHSRRNGLLLAAIFVGVAGVVLTNALIRGYQYDMREDAVKNLTGHFKVLKPGYLDDPSIEQSFVLEPGWQPEVPRADLLAWTSRVRVPAVVLSERETRGVQLLGIDPADERELSFLGEVAIRGETLVDLTDRRILLGQALLDQLGSDVGRRVVIITQGADGLNREAGYRVAGAFDAEGTALEKTFAFTGRTALQSLLDTEAVTEVSVRLTRERGRDRVGAALARELPDLAVKDWRALEPLAAAMFEMADAIVYVWLVIMLIALGFGLVNTLITAVMERVREFGMLRALGMRPGHVVAQVLIESSLVTLVGVAAGILGGMALVAYLADGIDLSTWAAGVEMAGLRSVLVPRLFAQDLLVVAVFALVLGLLGSAYPAWRAVRIGPLDALRRGT